MKTEVKPPENIVLIGFMGSGKSTLGRELQHMLGYELIDMDQEIERQQGRKIKEIFSESGEATFREMETTLLRELMAHGAEKRIISTGGGVVKSEANRVLLKQMGYVVWLRAPERIILERTSRNRDRPLLDQDDPLQMIRELLAEREPLYAGASHLQVDTGGLDVHELASGILECARYFFSNPQSHA